MGEVASTGRELERFAPLDPTLFGGGIVPDPEPIVPGPRRGARKAWEKDMRKGGLEPPALVGIVGIFQTATPENPLGPPRFVPGGDMGGSLGY
jgi:hypothetical protein